MIETQSLTKRYGDRAVVHDVSFTCEPGTVTGFLGLNGAGKSSTLKMLCGLTPITAGNAAVLGQPYGRHPNPGRRVGVLIDASAQHAGRRGREVLGVSAQLLGVGDDRIDQLLELVGLDHAAARKRVGQYSLGMRQRLGIAHALLGDPEVLILDEPANGLDPDGMRWMRGLLRDFAQRGGTVLLSSHLLHEIEAIADRLVIIAGGRIVAQGSRQDLLTAVELRKMVDTRAGFWLSAGVVAATARVVLISMLTGPAGVHTLERTLRFALQPTAFLLPVTGILLVTGEFSQRTAMTTFSLVPSRSRVLWAKLGAALVVSVAALAVCFAVSLIAVALGGDAGSATWSLNAAMVPQALVFVAAAMVTGVAFGAALLLSAPAIVAYLLLPTVWSALAGSIHALSGVARWLDQSETLAPMARHPLSATEWAHALATLAVWMLVPLLIGGWRLIRRDVG